MSERVGNRTRNSGLTHPKRVIKSELLRPYRKAARATERQWRRFGMLELYIETELATGLQITKAKGARCKVAARGTGDGHEIDEFMHIYQT